MGHKPIRGGNVPSICGSGRRLAVTTVTPRAKNQGAGRPRGAEGLRPVLSVAGAGAGTGIAPGDVYDTHLDMFYDSLGIALFVIGLVVRDALAAGARPGESTT